MNQNNTINIRAIRNKKSIRKDTSLQPKNVHDKYYDQSDDSDDERVLIIIKLRFSQKLEDCKQKSIKIRILLVTMRISTKS